MAEPRAPRALLAALLLVAPALAGAAEERPWYQVEVVLFANSGAAASTAELLTTEQTPAQAAAAVALGPAWPAPVRPDRTGALEILWAGVDEAPRLDRVTPGLAPELEDLLRWLARLDARSAPPDLGWIDELELIVDAPLEPLALPVPEIRPQVIWAAAPLGTVTDAAPAALQDGHEDDSAADALEGPVEIPLALAFRSVDRDRLVLATEASRLRRARDFDVLAHLAWRQPFEAQAPAIPVAVRWQDPRTGELRLAGNIGVALRRYLHVEFDLGWLEEDALDDFGEPITLWAPIEQSRRMRSGETHYVDHPRVGALVRITPFELAEPLADDAPARPLEGD